MDEYLHTHHFGAFKPDEVRLLISVYDDVWITLQATGTYFEGNFDNAREDLAEHIVETALEGERDPARLREAGIAFLKENLL